MRCTTLSLPLGAGGGVFRASMATVRVRVTMRVIGMSRYLRIMRAISQTFNATNVYKRKDNGKMESGCLSEFVGSDKQIN